MASDPATQQQRPSTNDIQRAQALLSNVATLLDSRSDKTGESSASSSAQPQPQTFPGLVEILPHLLAPLSGRGSIDTYRPLLNQVENVLSQLVSSFQDPTTQLPPAPGGMLTPSQSLKIAEAVRASRYDKSATGQGPPRRTKAERHEAILEARRKRRKRVAAGLAEQGDAERSGELASATDPGVPKRLTFSLPEEVADSGDGDEDMQDESTTPLERTASKIRARLRSLMAWCNSLDADSTISLSVNESPRAPPNLWLGEATSTRGHIRAQLPGVSDATIWFSIQGDDDDSLQVISVNIRTEGEASEDARITAKRGTTKLHLPSTNALMRQLSTEAMTTCDSDLTSTLLYILSLRTLNDPLPPLESQVNLEEQLGMSTGETGETNAKHIVLVGWYRGKSAVRWAWCKRRSETENTRHWRAYRAA